MRRVVRGVDDRVKGASFTREALRRPFPDHWTFMLGEVALYSFVVLVLTGTYLSFFYRASESPVRYAGPYLPLRGQLVPNAYDSVMRLSFEIRSGLVMRQIHHWAAIVFVLAIVVHLLRVFFTGAFRRPREINWLLGLSLFIIAMTAGFTGYSLPDDLLSGTGLRIAYSVVLSIPVIGSRLAFLLFGGEFPTQGMLSRLFVFHVMIIPALLVAIISAHVALVWRQKHSDFPGPGKVEDVVQGSALWPNYALKSAGLFFVIAGVLAMMGGLFQINPIWVYGPFKPYLASSPAQPDIYLGWLEGSLRLAPAWEPHLFGQTIPEPFIPAVALPGILFTILAVWPFLEARITRDHDEHHLLDRPREKPVRTAIGIAGLGFVTILTLAGSNDLIAKMFGVEVGTVNDIARVGLVVFPVVAGVATWSICRNLSPALHPLEGERVVLMRTRSGGFSEGSHALAEENDEAYRESDEPEQQ